MDFHSWKKSFKESCEATSEFRTTSDNLVLKISITKKITDKDYDLMLKYDRSRINDHIHFSDTLIIYVTINNFLDKKPYSLSFWFSLSYSLKLSLLLS